MTGRVHRHHRHASGYCALLEHAVEVTVLAEQHRPGDLRRLGLSGLHEVAQVEQARTQLLEHIVDYRDLVRTSLILDADFLAMLMPITYRTTTSIQAYARARHQLDAIYASSRLKLPFCGVLLVGY